MTKEKQERLVSRAKNLFGSAPLGLHERGVIVRVRGRSDCCSPLRDFLWLITTDEKIEVGKVRPEDVQWLT